MADAKAEQAPGGYLEVGSDKGVVIINHKDIQLDENGWGFIEFTPAAATQLASLLLKHATAAQRQKELY